MFIKFLLLVQCIALVRPQDDFNITAVLSQDVKIVDWILGVIGLGTTTTTTTTTTERSEPRDCQTCACGSVSSSARIINGSESDVNKYPWIAYLTYRDKFLCGATVISDNYLITAAHGIQLSKIQHFRAILLNHDRTKSEPGMITKRVIKIVVHEKFHGNRGFENDIALIKLEGTLPLVDGTMRSPCLFEDEYFDIERQQGTVLGWGITEQDNNSYNYSNTLQELNVPLWSPDKCKEVYQEKFTENMICAGFIEGGRDACKGDSGGPLQIILNDTYYLIGIISWGNGCAQPNNPGVYTKLSKYIEWIRNNTVDACYCE